MKRTIKTGLAALLALLLVVGLFPATMRTAKAEETELTVYDGNDTSGYVPVYGFYADAYTKSQFIIPADDLATISGYSISKLTFYASQESVSWGEAQFEVYMGEVDYTAITQYEDWSTLTKVMAEDSLSIADGKMVVELDTPYEYKGGNLLIGFIQTVNGAYITSTWYGMTETGASVQGYSYSSLESVSCLQRNFIPKTTFTAVGEPPAPHVHDWTYTAEGNTITATCTEDCPDAPKTLSILAPTELIADGTEKAATLSDYDETVFPGEHVIVYSGRNDTTFEGDVPPTAAGDYTASVTVEEATASVDFTIEKPAATFVAPEALHLAYTGEAQALLKPGSTEDGTMLYSADGVNFAEEIPTATEIGTYPVWFMVRGDADHADTDPEMLFATISMIIYGNDVSSLDVMSIEDGERVYRYDIRIKGVPENLSVNSMQVFTTFDPELLTLKRTDGPVEWTSAEKDNKLLFSWASDTEIPLKNEDVILSLIFTASDAAFGETVEFAFIENSLGNTSAVSTVENGKVTEYVAVTEDGSLFFEAPVYGDANCDGIVTAADASLILRSLVGLNALTPRGMINADVNCDLEVTAEDAALILRYIVSIIEHLPVAQND